MIEPPINTDSLYSVAQIRNIERHAMADLPPHALMKRAGEAAAHAAVELLTRNAGHRLPGPAPVLIAAGPGNNGGDAFECGACLARRGYSVTVLVPMRTDCPSPDTTEAMAHARACAVVFADLHALAALASQHWALVIDGLFGIGLTRPLTGIWRDVVDTLNAIGAPLLALDVPSGLNADTGMVAGDGDDEGACISATHTLSFIGNKPGLHTGSGSDFAGTVSVASLDIDARLYPTPLARLNQRAAFGATRHGRRKNSHKGSFGDVLVVGGSVGMTGAAILAAHAALKAGSGRVLIGFADPAQVPGSVAGHPEVMCRHAAELDFNGATLVVGPGLGSSTQARELVARACASAPRLVLDADGLNLVAADPALQLQVTARGARSAVTLLTPHPLEAARLLGVAVADVQRNRLGATQEIATKYQATVVLKGAGSVIACHNADDVLRINITGNPALATGGTGDVLAGICGALLAQGWEVHDAACAAVWAHGAAADRLVASGVGPIGVTASEVIDAARSILNDLVAGRVRPDDQQ